MFIANLGCLLPLLILLNFFFGRIFFGTVQWLAVGGVLLILLLLNSYIGLRRSFARNQPPARSGAIDVEGKVVK